MNIPPSRAGILDRRVRRSHSPGSGLGMLRRGPAVALAMTAAFLAGCTDDVPTAPAGAIPTAESTTESAAPPATAPATSAPADDRTIESAAGRRAFDTVYAVLQHPRCMNCHPAGDRPLQYDNGQIHIMNVQRGDDDRGRAGMRCITCHGTGNLNAPMLPPGADAEWQLAPKSMVFEGVSKSDMARMLLDPERSHMTKDELIEHVSHDALVMWGWNPGPGRNPVSVPHDEFVKAFKDWINAGAPVPQEDGS
jgi:mono/diheme cytochrome c family protein